MTLSAEKIKRIEFLVSQGRNSNWIAKTIGIPVSQVISVRCRDSVAKYEAERRKGRKVAQKIIKSMPKALSPGFLSGLKPIIAEFLQLEQKESKRNARTSKRHSSKKVPSVRKGIRRTPGPKDVQP
jgi:hypothetical protein